MEQQQPNAVYEAVVGVPIEAAWGLISEFGSWKTWWPLYEAIKIINHDTESTTRESTTIQGVVSHERMSHPKPGEYILNYDLVSQLAPQPPGQLSIKTSVKLDKVNAKATKITWSSITTLGGVPPEVIAHICQQQVVAYKSGVKTLVWHLVGKSLIEPGMAFFNNKAMAMARNLLVGATQTEKWNYAEYPKEYGFLPKKVDGLPPSQVMPAHKIGEMLGRFLEIIYLQIAELIQEVGTGRDPSPVIPYAGLAEVIVGTGHQTSDELKYLTKRLTETWEDDVEFCQQLLQGVDPLHIRVATAETKIPEPLAHLKVKTGESVQDLLEQRRLFYLDYSQLEEMVKNRPHHCAAPFVLLYREIVDENNSRLNMVGIILDTTTKTIYTPDMPQKNRYKLAKMFVACADNQIHEFRYHLGLSHWSMEPIAISIHNCLPKDYYLNALLSPHVIETIAINDMARSTLVAENNVEALTDNTFAVGTANGIKLASSAWQNFDFFKSSFPEDLKARGFDEDRCDGLTSYYYRDDGFKLWNALGHYTHDVVGHQYKSDDEVANDTILQTWANELADPKLGAIPGFPSKIGTRHLLAHVLQIIIWNGSALHSALNYSQWPYVGYVPNRPNALYQPMPADDGKDVTEEYIQSALAKTDALLFQLTFPWLLSLPSEGTLGNLEAMKKHHPEVDKKFKASMHKLTEHIKERNVKLEKEGKAPYIYLLPENVACSVNI